MDEITVNENQVNETFGEPNAPQGTPVPENTGTPAPESTPQQFEYTARGQTIKEDLDTILKRASMGYDYAQNLEGFKKEKQQWQETIQEREARLAQSENRWKQYDEYARTNPDWEQHVRTSWEQRQQLGFEAGTQQQPSSTGLPPEIAEKISKMDSFMENYQRAEEDAQLNKEIEAVKSQYPNLDFHTTDPNTGKSLEFKVLEHAKQNGISNFRAAFRDFYHDHLVVQAEERAKETVASTIQAQNKAGFIGESPTPQAIYQRPKTFQDMSWDDVFSEASKELGNN